MHIAPLLFTLVGYHVTLSAAGAQLGAVRNLKRRKSAKEALRRHRGAVWPTSSEAAERSEAFADAELLHELTGNMTMYRLHLEGSQESKNVRHAVRAKVRADRPVVVLKQARVGSSWFGEALHASGAWCHVRNEVTSGHREWCASSRNPDHKQCEELMNYTMQKMHCNEANARGGITLSPFQFHCHNPTEQSSCWNGLKQLLQKFDPYVIALTRRNVVLQAASQLKSMEVVEDFECSEPFHLEMCSEEVAQHRAAPDPAELLGTAKKKQREANIIRDIASKLAPPERVFDLRMEDLLEDGADSFRIPSRVWNFLGLGPITPRSLVADYRGTRKQKLNQGSPRLKSYVANFQEIKLYFEEHAPPDLLSMIYDPVV